MRELGPDGWEYHAADLFTRPEVPRFTTASLDEAFPHDADFFDYVACLEGIEHGENYHHLLRQCHRVPQGQLISIPTGIDTDRCVPAEPMEARRRLDLPLDKAIIGVVATLRHGKGHDCLLDAVHHLGRDDVHLLIVGHGKMRPAIDAQIERLGMAERVTLPGNQDDVVPWLQAMDVFTLPSYANEGAPQCIMQAMSCGLPVVPRRPGASKKP